MDFQLDNNLPIWPQLLERMTERILTRRYPPGSKLPSVRELALEAGVNPNTVMRTFVWLQQQELIYMKRGIGYFVAPNACARILQMRKEYFFDHEANYFFDRLSSFGISPEQLMNAYTDFLANSTK